MKSTRRVAQRNTKRRPSSVLNCEAKRRTIKMAKNPIGRRLGIGHAGMTCQNEPTLENCEAKKETIKMAKNPIGNHKGLGGMTCQQPISHDSFHSACKTKETTDGQSTSEQVRKNQRTNPQQQNVYAIQHFLNPCVSVAKNVRTKKGNPLPKDHTRKQLHSSNMDPSTGRVF